MTITIFDKGKVIFNGSLQEYVTFTGDNDIECTYMIYAEDRYKVMTQNEFLAALTYVSLSLINEVIK